MYLFDRMTENFVPRLIEFPMYLYERMIGNFLPRFVEIAIVGLPIKFIKNYANIYLELYSGFRLGKGSEYILGVAISSLFKPVFKDAYKYLCGGIHQLYDMAYKKIYNLKAESINNTNTNKQCLNEEYKLSMQECYFCKDYDMDVNEINYSPFYANSTLMGICYKDFPMIAEGIL